MDNFSFLFPDLAVTARTAAATGNRISKPIANTYVGPVPDQQQAAGAHGTPHRSEARSKGRSNKGTAESLYSGSMGASSMEVIICRLFWSFFVYLIGREGREQMRGQEHTEGRRRGRPPCHQPTR